MLVTEFNILLQKNFDKITKNVDNLFIMDVDKDVLWNTYLDNFPTDVNPMFRTNREFDCNCCKQFIRTIGGVVVIEKNKLKTIWDFTVDDEAFQTVINALSTYVKSVAIKGLFLAESAQIGTDYNIKLTTKERFDHLYLTLPAKFVYDGSRTLGTKLGEFNTNQQVFKRSLDEITQESLDVILELIATDTLYRGNEWESVLKEVLKHKKAYTRLSKKLKINYTWEQSAKAGPVICKIKNHSIGTLLINVSEGMDLDIAVKKYEAIVAPTNYKRPKPIFTKKMLEAAVKTVTELGFMDALERRFATLNDITINNIFFANKDTITKLETTPFDNLMQDISVSPKKFSKAQEISVGQFLRDILPSAKKVEVLFENKHRTNLVSLIAPKNKTAPSMLKWNNNFTWSYDGNVTDSLMKERVKSAGGNVTGDLRFSIQWNDIENDCVDLDAHCNEPTGYTIYYGNRGTNSPNGGNLDVDIINPRPSKPAVENITYANRQTMKDGNYEFLVHNYSSRGTKRGFRAEIEFDGQIYSFNYDKPTKGREKIKVAEVVLKNGSFIIKPNFATSMNSVEFWNLKTQQFVPVYTIMNSPNYWDEQTGIGNRHLFFMLKNCLNPDTPNGFYNEFLREEFMKHKKVFEALGSKMKVAESDDQLSGLGFSLTKRNTLIVKVINNTERIFNVKF